MVTSATRRARHAGTRPAWTCAHSRGSRWRSSRAWPTSFFAAVVEMPEDGAELGEAELRDQRRTLTGDGFFVLATRDGERSGVVDRLRRVQVGPPGCEDQLAGRLCVLDLARGLDRSQQVASGEVLDLTCSGPCQRLDHVFDSTCDHRQRRWTSWCHACQGDCGSQK